MSKFFESIVVLYSILISIVVTFAYLYFIFIPIKYIALNVLAWYDLPQEIAIYIHIITVSILVLLGQIHVYKWFIRDYVTNECCDKCGNKVIVSNREKSSDCLVLMEQVRQQHSECCAAFCRRRAAGCVLQEKTCVWPRHRHVPE